MKKLMTLALVGIMAFATQAAIAGDRDHGKCKGHKKHHHHAHHKHKKDHDRYRKYSYKDRCEHDHDHDRYEHRRDDDKWESHRRTDGRWEQSRRESSGRSIGGIILDGVKDGQSRY